MNNFLSYLTEVSLALTAFYGGYYFILRHKAVADFNRFYLLGSLLLALGLPFVHIPLTTADTGAVPVLWEPASQAWKYLPELVIYGKGQPAETAQTASAFYWLLWDSRLYLAGVLISLLLTGRLLRLRKLIRQYPFRYSSDYSYQLAPTNGEHPTFSFLHYITAGLSPKEEA